jgi:hypothetical protein
LIPVGGRLQFFWKTWEQKGASEWVSEVLRWGYKLEFWERPPLTRTPVSFPDPHRHQILTTEIAAMVAKGALEVVHDQESPGFYSRLFVVPKPDNRWRPVIDLKVLNWYLKIPKFKMESLQSIWGALLPGNYTISIDLQDAYFHVPIHKEHRKYLRIYHNGVVYQFRALPFGLSTAPWLFTRIMVTVKEFVHLQAIQLYLYLDDWLAQMASHVQGEKEALFLLQLCQELGLVVNWKKSELVPSQDFNFIGAHFNLREALVTPKEENRQKTLKSLKRFLRIPSHEAVVWQSILGLLASQFRFVRYGQLYLRPLQWHLQDSWDCRGDPHTQIAITGEIRTCLRWWEEQLLSNQGVPLLEPPPSVHIFTDASMKGWGAHVADATYQGRWSPQESRLMINLLELRAVRLALSQHNPPPHSVILVATDNVVTKSYINKQGGTRSRTMMQETSLLYTLVMSRQWTIRARHIAGKLNVLADQLSREDQILPGEWSLSREALEPVFRSWGHPLVDLCATSDNKKCQMFVSPFPHPEALAVDALSVDLTGMEAYAFPPYQILGNILKRFQAVQRCRLIVIAPWWPAMSWFPLLLQLKVLPPMRLRTSRKMLRQPRRDVFHSNPEQLALHAWLLEKLG